VPIEFEPGSLDAAVAILSGDGGEAPATEAPAEAAPTPAPAPAEPAPTEAPAEPAAAPDEEAQLLADLEARKQARQAKSTPTEVAALKSEVAELRALLGKPNAQQTADFKALVAQHGEVEALRQIGIDPLAFFGGFREKAKDLERAKAMTAAERALAEAAEAKKTASDYIAEQQKREQAAARAQMERDYLALTEAPDAGLQFLPKMSAQERLRRTYAMIDRLSNEVDDVSQFTDRQLAKLVDMEVRDEIRRLTGTDPGVTTPKPVPVTDGAKKPAPPASLTNDLASQYTGGRKLEELTDRESFELAKRLLETGVAEV
jgi:hypothetical protein